MKEQPTWLVEREIIIDGHPIIYSYDKEGDVLEVIFQKGGGIGIDLTDNIVLRYNRDRQEPLSLILTSFSHLTQPLPFDPPSFQLTVLNDPPRHAVNHFVHVKYLLRQLLSEDIRPTPLAR